MSAVEISSDLKSGLGLGGASIVEDLLVGIQRFGFPVSATSEQAMLDGIPFGSTGGVVRNGDAQSQAIAQLPLNFLLPGDAAPLLPPVSARMTDVAGWGIELVPFYLPLSAKAGDGEGGCFMGNFQEHTAAVGLGIVDAIRNADTRGGGSEVMIIDAPWRSSHRRRG